MPHNNPQFLPGESLSLGVSCLLSMQAVSFAQSSVQQDTRRSAKARLAGNRLKLAPLKVRSGRKRGGGIEWWCLGWAIKMGRTKRKKNRQSELGRYFGFWIFRWIPRHVIRHALRAVTGGQMHFMPIKIWCPRLTGIGRKVKGQERRRSRFRWFLISFSRRKERRCERLRRSLFMNIAFHGVSAMLFLSICRDKCLAQTGF